MIPSSPFYETLSAEVLDNAGDLPPALHQRLGSYYPHLRSPDPGRRAFTRYNWLRRTAPLARLIRALPSRPRPWRLLDAGCGVGSESLFWSSLRSDLEVTGVDIAPDRLEIAQARQAFHEKRLGRPQRVRFLEGDVFKLLESDPFDLLWSMEAISHIDPAERFLSAAFANLGSPGYLAISDSHLLNPYMAWRIYSLRRKAVAARTRKTISSGETIGYAQERLFSLPRLARLLKEAGFTSLQSQMSVFFPPSLARLPWLLPFLGSFDQALDRIPGLRFLGGIYTLIAFKNGNP